MYIKKIKVVYLVFLLSFINLLAEENAVNSINPFELESINHWNFKLSSVNWQSATVKNSLEIPYITFISDFVKGKYNLILYDYPKNIKGVSYQFSTPKCYVDKCSDLYFRIIVSTSNYFPAYKQNQEISITNFKTSTDTSTTTIINDSNGVLSSKKQDLKNLVIGYNNDFYFFQKDRYLKNLGIRLGLELDMYQYKATISGLEFLNSLYKEEYQNNPSNNKTINNNANIFITNNIDYLEAVVKLKVGLNYVYEFLQTNLIFAGIDLHFGYGALSYKLKEERFNTDFINILNSSQINPLALSATIPQARVTDGPATLQIPGYECYLSYGYKIDPNQIVRVVYRYKQEYHIIKNPKIEPDENINLSAVSQGDLTAFVLSQIEPRGKIPSNSEFMREIGIEYMNKF
jgi:hypothetical protein